MVGRISLSHGKSRARVFFPRGAPAYCSFWSVNWLDAEHMVCIGYNWGVSMGVYGRRIGHWFKVYEFLNFRLKLRNEISVLLTIVWETDFVWSATEAKFVPYQYELAASLNILLMSEVMHRSADRTEDTENGHDVLCSMYREKFAERGISPVFTKKAWHVYLQ